MNENIPDTMVEARKEMYAALAGFQAACPPIPKARTATIPGKDGKTGYKYQYAALEDIANAIREPLAEHGLAWFQDVQVREGMVAVTTWVTHTGGYAYEVGPFVLPAGHSPQTAGSATSYGRRYGLSAALGIVTEEDDDAAGATHSADAAPAKSGEEDIPMSDRQRRLIMALAKEKGLDNTALHGIASKTLGEEVTTLTVLTGGRDGTATQFIDVLTKWKPVEEDEPYEPSMSDEDLPF